jgi:RalA-binding protein 1
LTDVIPFISAPAEEGPSDDDYSLQDESGAETTDGDGTVESSESSSGPGSASPDTPIAPKSTKASHTAASRGLNVTVTQSERGNRYSRMMGLPVSPRPSYSPSQLPDVPSSPIHTTKQ